MDIVKAYIEKEQKLINSCIQTEIHSLHSTQRAVAQHIFSSGGKRLRPILMLLISRHFGYNANDIYALATAVELIHSATLLHDDILDNSTLRRGIATAHTLFGTRTVILVGDALLAKGCHLVASTAIPELLGRVSEIIMDTVAGEIEEIAQEGTIISFTQYIEIIRGKTAKMIQKACEMSAIIAGASAKEVTLIGTFGENLGLAFQMVDDILDYATSGTLGKPRGIDIMEGKLTAPLLLYAETLPQKEKEELLYSVVNKQYTEEELLQIIDAISTHKAIDKSYYLVQEYIDVALGILSEFAPTQERELLYSVTLHSIHRTH